MKAWFITGTSGGSGPYGPDRGMFLAPRKAGVPGTLI